MTAFGTSPAHRLTIVCLLGTASLCFVAASQTTPADRRGISNVISADAKIELVKDGFEELEGPVGTPDGGLYFSDTSGNRTYRLDKSGAISVWRENTSGTNGLFLLGNGRLLAAETRGPRVISVMPDGSVAPVATMYAGQKLRGPNDLIADKKGGVYFTDPAPRPAPNAVPKEPGNVLYISPGGDVLLIDDQIRRPNGLSLSIDEKTLYVDDTEGEFLYAFDVQPDGTVKNKRQFVKLLEPVEGSLGPRSRADGMCVDSEGRIYVTTGAGLQVISPGGEHLGIVRTPTLIRNIAFSGPDRRTLYMTAVEALYRVQMLSRGPSGRAK